MSAPTVATRQTTLLRRLFSREALGHESAPVYAIALVSVVAHLLVAGNYGYFRDELYYLMDGRHLAFGYVDQPALIGWLAALMNVLTGDNLIALHVVSALANGALIVVTGLMARELGGGRFAQALAALGSAVMLVFMATGSIFSMDILDALIWATGAYVLIRLLKEQRPRLWLVFGLVAGVGLLNKLTILFFGLAVVLGFLLTPERRLLRSRWLWLGGLIAAAFLLPYAIWNAVNGFPTWEFWHHYGGLSGGGPIGFLGNQLFAINPFTVPLVICGLWFSFRTAAGKPYRALGWTYVLLYLILTLINAKSYFLAPAYPILFAGGAVVIERAALKPKRVWLGAAYAGVLALSGLVFAPTTMPVLPPATFVADYGWLTGAGNGAAGQGNAGAFPQYLGDRFGWDTMTATVARVYDGLPAPERAQACILTANYGEASAITFFGPQYHLPPAISGHNNFYLWGPGSCSGKVVITVNFARSDLEKSYGSVVPAATITCDYCQAEENDVPVYVATQLKVRISDAWPTIKHYN